MIAKEKELVKRLLDTMRPLIDAGREVKLQQHQHASIGGYKTIQVYHLHAAAIAFDTLERVAQGKRP